VVLPEPEAQEHVGDRRSHPIGGDEVERVEPPEVKGAVVVGGREVGLGPVVEVPDVVNGDEIARNRCARQPRDLRRPVPVVGRLDGAPVEEERDERGPEEGENGPAPPARDERAQPEQGE